MRATTFTRDYAAQTAQNFIGNYILINFSIYNPASLAGIRDAIGHMN